MAEQIITKQCCKCKQTKPLAEFHKEQTHKDGHRSDCKICRLKYSKEYYQSEKGKARIKQYQQTKQGKIVLRKAKLRYRQTEKYKITHKLYQQSEQGKVANKRYHIRHPGWHKARVAVNDTVRLANSLAPILCNALVANRQNNTTTGVIFQNTGLMFFLFVKSVILYSVKK